MSFSAAFVYALIFFSHKNMSFSGATLFFSISNKHCYLCVVLLICAEMHISDPSLQIFFLKCLASSYIQLIY